MKFPIESKFSLTDNFIGKYKSVRPDFGFDGLGEFVFFRTYSRIKDDGENEQWWETIRRVVEGIYSIQKQHIKDYNLGWNQSKAQHSAQEMYDRMFNFKMLGSGRALWSLGTDVVMKKGLTESLFNCSFLSTKDFGKEFDDVFPQMMDLLMLGVGVGSDVKVESNVIIREPYEKKHIFVIPDTREGWVDSLRVLIKSYLGEKNYTFDYSEIRDAGEPIKTFGGIASGFQPLKKLHDEVSKILEKNIGKVLSKRAIADISNNIAVCVVSGNVRRSAIILLGDNSEEFLDLKDYAKNPERTSFGWSSNNSVLANIGDNYSELIERTIKNAEPGFVWLNNFRNYGRMIDGFKQGVDGKIDGLNPCSEVGLEAGEFCNLSEIIPSRHDDIEDYKKTIKYAYLFAKTITLLNTNWVNTNRTLLRNRRIGLSITGVSQFVHENSLSTMIEWMDEGYRLAKSYDEIYSDWFAIPKSIKLTTLKPSGTLSLLAGVTPGVHFPQANYYIRRVRLAKNSKFIKTLKKAGYKIEDAFEDPENTSVVEFPVSLGSEMKTIGDVSMWEQGKLAEVCQRYWADNGVSVTITFDKDEECDLDSFLQHAQFNMKAVSFLPKSEGSAYPQMPYENITKKEYLKMAKKISPVDYKGISEKAVGEKYCETDVCELETETDNIEIKLEELKLG